jgi:hypothetical protein
MFATIARTAKCHCAVWHMPADANELFSYCDGEQLGPDISMNIVWIIISVAIVGMIAKRVALAGERHGHAHLGFVSHQWLAENRLSQVSNPQR